MKLKIHQNILHLFHHILKHLNRLKRLMKKYKLNHFSVIKNLKLIRLILEKSEFQEIHKNRNNLGEQNSHYRKSFKIIVLSFFQNKN